MGDSRNGKPRCGREWVHVGRGEVGRIVRRGADLCIENNKASLEDPFCTPAIRRSFVFHPGHSCLPYIILFITMAHRRTQSARFPDQMYGNSPLPSPVLEPPFTPAAVSFAALTSIANRKPRTYWYRTTFLALFVLVVLSVYVLLVAQPSLSPIPVFESDSHTHPHLSSDAFRLAALRHKHSWTNNDSTTGRTQVQLNASQELAAVSSFIASLPHNVIPGTVDPSKPIDPQLVLDFDTTAAHAAVEVETVVKDVWAQHPVMLYSKVSALSLFAVGPPSIISIHFHLLAGSSSMCARRI